jgi:Fe-S-cluster formation regulator IscX/YfhJ
MTKTAAAPAPAMDVDNNQHGVKLNGHQVRFDFLFNDRDPVPQAPKVLHLILRRLVDSCGGDIDFRDVHSTVVDLDNFPQDKATFNSKFNTAVSDQAQRHILLVLEIRSVKTLYALKQIVWQWLSKHNVYMKPNTLGLHQVDVCSPGLFSHTNPTYHSKERVKDDIYLI